MIKTCCSEGPFTPYVRVKDSGDLQQRRHCIHGYSVHKEALHQEFRDEDWGLVGMKSWVLVVGGVWCCPHK